MMTAIELRQFEQDIASLFEAGYIKAPVHLHGGNEEQLIEIFQQVKPDDWVFSTHRSHYHALLKGIPPELVKTEILNGHSINLQFPMYRFYTSAIVGGIVPIALGVAMSGQRVWCFVGDMAGHTGIFHDCVTYANGHNLPITFVVESNGYSVETPTCHVWGCHCDHPKTKELHYSYERKFPHQGSGVNVLF